ncbi:MAG TPA: condensation domain-containing protein, partial [Ktedonobacteraceae bacterium]
MSDLARRIAALSPQKQELLRQHLQQQRQAAPSGEIRPHRGAADSAPLSFAQQRLWFLDQWERERWLYTASQALQLSGPLQRATLRRCLREIVRRHETLRTIFVLQDDQPAQVVLPAFSVPLSVLDLRALPAEQRRPVAHALMQQEMRQPFDLARGPLLRTHLLQIDAQEHLLLLTLHHIVADGWSQAIFFHELTVLYSAFAAGQPSPLPELSIQYSDVARWQRATLQGEVLADHLAYWRRTLAMAPTLLALPTDHPRPAVQTFQGARHGFVLPRALSARLHLAGQQAGATLFMTLLAALQIFLWRYSGQEDLLIGTPIANRKRAELETLIGFFVNMLVLRARINGHSSFQQMLARVRQETLDAYAHQDLPFEVLVEHLQPERSLSHTPLFQVAFALHNAPQAVRALSGLHIEPLTPQRESARVDLSLSIQETAQGLCGWWEYSTDLFGAQSIARWHTHFLTLLHALLAHPQQPIASLPLLSPSQHSALLTS